MTAASNSEANEYAIENGWLCEVAKVHTCGTDPGGYFGAHEPGCGLLPVARIDDLLAAHAAQATQVPVSQPIPAPVDSGAIGRLNGLLATHRPNVVTEEVGPLPLRLRTRVKCDGDSCGFYTEGDRYWDVVQRHTDHLTEAVADLVREHTDRALAEALADIRTRRQVFNRLGAHEQYLMALDDAFGLVNNRLAIVRAARQGQGR